MSAVVLVIILGLIGLGGGLLIIAPVAVAVLLVTQYVHQHRRVHALEVGWSGSSAVVTAAPPAAPARNEPLVHAARGRGGVAGSLARVETRELVASPWFHVGVGFWLVILVMFGVVFVDDVDRSWIEFFGLSALMCHPLAAFTIVAAHRNRTRSRRDDCDEMFDACPADANARTLGHLATAWVPAVIQVLFVLALAALIATRSEHSYGPWGIYVVAALLGCAVLGAGAVALGVTLGRWAPWGLVPFVAVVAVGVASGNINGIGQPAFSTDRLLATLVATTGVDPIFIPWLWWERLAWLAAISTVVAAIGLLGGRSTRVVTAVLGGATVVALVSAALIARPATNDADRIADLVAEPVANSTCVSAGSEVEVCVYDGYEGLARDTAAELAPVAAAVPDGVLDGVVFLTFYEQPVELLSAETQDALGDRVTRLPEGVLRLRYNSHPENFEAARLRLAARAVGLPTEAMHFDDGDLATPVAGQARGVIVLWLAARGLDAGARERLIRADGLTEPLDASDRGSIWPASCHEDSAVLQWSPTDLEAARVLLDLPGERVAQILATDWTALTAPDATTDQLLTAVGADPLGDTEPIEARGSNCG